MAVPHADERILPVAAVVGENESRDAGGVGLEREGDQIEHQAEVIFVGAGNAGGAGVVGAAVGELIFAIETLLEFADGIEIIVELAPVGGAELCLERSGVVHGEVENAFAIAIAFEARLGFLAGPAVAEKAVEHQLGIDLRRHRGGLGLPRNVERIGAAVAGVTFAGEPGAVRAEFEGGQAGARPELLRRDLVHRHPDLDVGSASLARFRGRQEGGGRPGMVSSPVAVRPAFVLGEAGQNRKLRPDGLQRLEGGGQDEIGSGRGRGPVVQVDAVRHVDKGHAARRGRHSGRSGGRGGAGQRRSHRFEQRQGDGGADSSQKCSSRQLSGAEVQMCHNRSQCRVDWGRAGPGLRPARRAS